MFIDEKKLGTRMKDGYKIGLTIGDINDGLLISNSFWLLWIDNKYVSNKVKALVVEYAGDMPTPGSLFKVSKNEPNPQYVVDKSTFESLAFGYKQAYENFEVTPVTLGQRVQVLQNKKNLQVWGIDTDYISIIDKSKIDYEIESEPTGPCSIHDRGAFYWYNGICVYCVIPISVKDEALKLALETVNFSKKEDE